MKARDVKLSTIKFLNVGNIEALVINRYIEACLYANLQPDLIGDMEYASSEAIKLLEQKFTNFIDLYKYIDKNEINFVFQDFSTDRENAIDFKNGDFYSNLAEFNDNNYNRHLFIGYGIKAKDILNSLPNEDIAIINYIIESYSWETLNYFDLKLNQKIQAVINIRYTNVENNNVVPNNKKIKFFMMLNEDNKVNIEIDKSNHNIIKANRTNRKGTR